jgi:adenylate cyclase
MTEQTRAAVSEPMTLHEFGKVEPKGVLKPVTLFQVTGIGGRHATAVEKKDEDWTEVAPPMTVHFRPVVDKKVVGQPLEGQLTARSDHAVHIKSTSHLAKFTDLQLELIPSDGSEPIGDIYAKVLNTDPETGAYIVGLTATPSRAREILGGSVKAEAT